MTCVQLGLACMEEIYAAGGELDLALTLHDHKAVAKSGRVFLDAFCKERGTELVKVDNINEPAAIESIQSADLDWLFIIGWSQIARSDVLGSVRRGVLGMHPTLLPAGRGRASIPWAILKQLPETGVTLFQLDEGVDTGPILAQERIVLSKLETATRLYDRVANAHRVLLRRAWPSLVSGRIVAVPQDESRASVWPARRPGDGDLSPDMSVAAADRLVRAVTRPYPGAVWRAGPEPLRVWAGRISSASQPLADGSLRLRFRDGTYDALDFEPVCASLP